MSVFSLAIIFSHSEGCLFILLIVSFAVQKLLSLTRSYLDNLMDRGAWCAAVHGVVKSWTQLSDFTLTFHFHVLEKEMATHSSALAWRIPGTGSLVGCRLWDCTELDMTEATSTLAWEIPWAEEPGRLQSMGSGRVGHD